MRSLSEDASQILAAGNGRRSGNTGMQDLMAGLIDLMIDPAANSVPQVRAGTIKAYAVTSRQRTPAAPIHQPIR